MGSCTSLVSKHVYACIMYISVGFFYLEVSWLMRDYST